MTEYQQDQVIWTDEDGRKWDLSLNLAIVRRIDASDYSELTDIDVRILKMDHRTVSELLMNEALLYGVIYTALHRQIISAWPDDSEEDRQEQFAAVINSRNKRQLQDAWWKAYTDFFPERESLLSTLQREWSSLRQLEATELEKHLGAVGGQWKEWAEKQCRQAVTEAMAG